MKGKNARKKAEKHSDAFSVPELHALILWAFMEASAGGKLTVQVAYGDTPGNKLKYKKLMLDRKVLPPIDSVRLPMNEDMYQEIEESN